MAPFMTASQGKMFGSFLIDLGVTTLRRRLSSNRMNGVRFDSRAAEVNKNRGYQNILSCGGCDRMVGSSEQSFDNHAGYVFVVVPRLLPDFSRRRYRCGRLGRTAPMDSLPIRSNPALAGPTQGYPPFDTFRT